MATNAHDPETIAPGETPSIETAEDGASPEAILPGESPEPPILSGKALLRRGFMRWLVLGMVRLLYRWWTRVAVHVFPEDSRRAALATGLGIPLPDRLNLSWITPHLAVGGRVRPEDLHRLAGAGLTHVVDTRSERQDDEQALASEGITLLCLPAPDTHPLTVQQLREGAAWINAQIKSGSRVLVHCEHGVGRSVLLAAAALVASGMNAHDAIQLIQRRRWQAAPNHRQIRRLQEFERAIHRRQPSLS